MPSNKDERIVSMQFENEKFEKGVAHTMNTLEKLKASLSFKGIDKAFEKISMSASNVKFDGLEDSIVVTSQKFNALERIASGVFMRIGNQIAETGERLLKSLTIDPILRGWEKMDSKAASVQTIMNATGKSMDEVDGYLAELMWFADETSYGFSDMTSAISQMTSAGGDIEKLIPMVMGIANATAYAGKGASEFSRIIYNLNQSYSGGYLNLMDWKSVKLAGANSKELVNTLIEAGVALGKIKEGQVDISNFDYSLADRWADKEVMELAFSRFAEMSEKAYEMVQTGQVETASEAYEILAEQYEGVGITAAKAAQEAKTFTEAIDATKEAVQTKWMSIFETIFGNYEQAKKTWTSLSEDLWDIFASPLDDANIFLTKVFGEQRVAFDSASRWNALVEDNAEVAKQLQKALMDIANENGLDFSHAFMSGKTFGDILGQGWITADMFDDALSRISTTAKNTTLTLDDLVKVANEVKRGDWGNGAERFKRLTEAGYDYEVIQDIVGSGTYGLARAEKWLAEQQKDTIQLTDSEAASLAELASNAENANTPLGELYSIIHSRPTGRENFLSGMQNILTSIKYSIEAVRKAWSNIFPAKAGRVYDFIAGFRSLTETFMLTEERAGRVQKVFESLFRVFRSVGDIVGATTKGVFTTIGKIIGKTSISTEGALERITNWLNKFSDSTKVVRAIESAFNSFNNALDKIGFKGIFSYLGLVWEGIKKVSSGIRSLGSSIRTSLQPVIPSILAFFSSFGGKFVNTIRTVSGRVSEFFEHLKGGKASAEGTQSVIERLQTALSAIPEILSKWKIFNKVKTWISGFGKNVKKWFAPGSNTFSDFFNNLKESPMKALTSFTSKVKELFDRIREGQPISEAFHEIVGKVSAKFQELRENITEAFGATKVGELFEKIPGWLDGARKDAKGVIDDIKRYIEGVDWDKVVAFVGFVALISTLTTLSRLMDKGAGLLSNMSTFVGALTGVTRRLFNFTTTFESVAAGVVKIALSIILIVGALKVLASVPKDRLFAAAEALGALVLVIGLLIGVLGSLKIIDPVKIAAMSKAFVAIGLAFIALAASVWIMAKAIQELNDAMQFGESLRKVAALIVALLASIVILAGITKLLGKIDVASVAAIVALAAAIWILSNAISTLATIQDVDKMKAAVQAVMFIMAELAIAGVIAGRAGLGAGLGFLSAAAAVYLMVGFLVIMASPKIPDLIRKAEKNIDAMKIVFTALMGLALIMIAAGAMGGKGGFGLLLTTVSMLLLVQAVKKIAELDMSPAQMKKVLSTLTWLAIILDVMSLSLLAASKGDKPVERALSVVALAGVIYVLYKVMEKLGRMKPQELSRGLAAISAMMIGMSAVVLASRNMGSFKSFLGFAIAFGAVGLALIWISQIDSASLWKAAGVIAAVMGAMAFAVLLLREASASFNKSSIVPLIILAAIIGEMVAIIALLADLGKQNPKAVESIGSSLIKIFAGISLMAAAFGYMIQSVGAVNPIAGAGIGLIFIAGVAAILYGIYELSTKANPDKVTAVCDGLLKAFAGVAILAVGLGIAFAAIGMVAPAIGPALIAFTEIILVTGAIAVVLGEIQGLLAKFDPGLMDRAIELGGKIGEFLGSIVGGFGVGITNGLPQMAENLSMFAENIGTFLTAVKGIKPDDIQGFIGLKDVFVAVSKITPELANNVGSFFDFITSFGEKIVEFSNTTSGVNASKMNTLGLAAQKLSDAVSIIVNIKGLSNENTTAKSIAGFASAITDLGDAMTAADKVGESINTENVSKVVEGATEFTKIIEALPKEGGLWGSIAGEKDLAGFGSKIKAFLGSTESGSGLASATEAINNYSISASMVKRIASDAGVFAELADSLQSEGGIWQKVAGESDLAGFGDKIKAFLTGTSETGGLIGAQKYINEYNVDSSKIDMLIKDAGKFNDFAQALSKGGGIINAVSDSANLVAFAGNIRDFSRALQDTGISGMDVDQDGVNSVFASLEQMIQVVHMASSEKFKMKDFNAIANELPTLAGKIKKFTNKLGEINSDAIIKASEALSETGKLVEKVAVVGSSLASTMTSSFVGNLKIDQDLADNLDAFGKTLIRGLQDSMNGAIGNPNGGIADLIGLIADGFTLGPALKKATDAGTEYGTAIITAISNLDFQGAGVDAAKGFILGIESMTERGRAAGRALANSALFGIRAELDEHSPSKETYNDGQNFVFGFVNGISSLFNDAERTASQLGLVTGNALTNSWTVSQRAFDSAAVITPTIASPVYDLGALQTASSLLNSLNASGSYNIAATMDYGLKQMQDMQLLIGIATDILHSVQNGSDLYLDNDVLAGRINRRLGQT